MRIDVLPAPFDQLDSKYLKPVSLKKGQRLFRQGDSTEGLFFLVAGKIEFHRFTRNGELVVIHRAGENEIFAEASLFSPQYHCDACVLEDAEVLRIDKEAVLGLFASDHDFATSLAHRFAQQLQSYRRRVELLSIRSANERVYAAIKEGLLAGDIKQLADEIGLTSATVYRSMAALVKEGKLLKLEQGQYSLPGLKLQL